MTVDALDVLFPPIFLDRISPIQHQGFCRTYTGAALWEAKFVETKHLLVFAPTFSTTFFFGDSRARAGDAQLQPYEKHPLFAPRVTCLGGETWGACDTRLPRDLITNYHHCLLIVSRIRTCIAMSNPETRSSLSKIMVEKALWNCCVSLSLTEIMPNLYLGG